MPDWWMWLVVGVLGVCVGAVCWIQIKTEKRVRILETVISQLSPEAGRRLVEQGTGVTSNWTAPWGDASEEYDHDADRS